MNMTFQMNQIVFLPLILQLGGLTYVVLCDNYIEKSHQKLFLIIIGLIFSLMLENQFDYRISSNSRYIFIKILNAVYGYSIRPVILMAFILIVSTGKEKNGKILLILLFINILIHLTAFFSKICIYYSEGAFYRGPLGYTCIWISGVMLVELLYISITKYRKNLKSEAFLPVLNVILIILAVWRDLKMTVNTSVSFLTIVIVSCSVFYYIWLHLQFVREHEQALLAEQRIQVMISQIQPHFLFNTLSTIQALCEIDPHLASDTIEKFGSYLRQNLDSLSQSALIPFRKELEHTKIYTDIEQLRFPNIQVDYNIMDDGFSIPALTVQPLVENAIRHGVRIREQGLVQITTRKEMDAHEIIIQDNGKGFDPETAGKVQDGHIGIANVRERIENLCGGTLTVDSRINEGTIVTMRIPVDPSERRS